MATENEVCRAALEVGTAVTEVTKARLMSAMEEGRLSIKKDELTVLFDVIDKAGAAAAMGAMKSFQAKFDEYKIVSDSDPKY